MASKNLTPPLWKPNYATDDVKYLNHAIHEKIIFKFYSSWSFHGISNTFPWIVLIPLQIIITGGSLEDGKQALDLAKSDGRYISSLLSLLNKPMYALQWRRQPQKSGGSEPCFFAGEQ